MTQAHRLVPSHSFGPRKTNGQVDLFPNHAPGERQVEFNIPGVRVGTAEYPQGPTGATILSFPGGVRTAVDVRGGAVGLLGGYPVNDAICLAGGSVYGLSAATGVAEVMLEEKGGRSRFDHLARVSGAIIYDFSARDNSIYPDAALGAAAYRAAQHNVIAVGRVGGGASASAGKIDWSRTEFTGQGAAFRQVGDVKVLVVTLVNPIGVLVDREGTVLRGNFNQKTGQRRHPNMDFMDALTESATPALAAGNTTVTAVVTNVALADEELNQLAKQVHSSMHRAIQPFHTAFDGDVLFAATTDEVQLPPDSASSLGRLSVHPTAVGSIASEVAWDAVLSTAV